MAFQEINCMDFQEYGTVAGYARSALDMYIYIYIYIYSPNKALAEEGFLLGFYRSTFAHQVFGPSPVVAGRRRLLA